MHAVPSYDPVLCVSINIYNKPIHCVTSTDWLINVCHTLPSVSFQRNINLQNVEEMSWAMIEICETFPIPRDGNCLFSCFSTLVSGNTGSARLFRKLVCDEMHKMPFSVFHFVAQQGNNCVNALDYLSQTKMRDEGVYGGDIEIAVFCTLFKVDLVVYVNSFNNWVVYSGFHGIDEPYQMFIRHSDDHWEPIVCLKRRGSNCKYRHRRQNSIRIDKLNNLSIDEVRDNNMKFRHNLLESKTKKSKNFSIDFDQDTAKNFKSFPYDYVSFEKCQKCGRRSTVWYPLQLQKVETSKITKRKYGLSIGKGASVCQDCVLYLSPNGNNWKYAWPSVLFDLVFVKQMCKVVDIFFKLPRQIQFSWLFERLIYADKIKEDPLFNDITRDVIEFKRLLDSFMIKDYKEAMNKYPYPAVRCFCGASEFIERTGHIEFNHVLNFAQSNFSDFKSNWREHLRSIRYDFFELCDMDLVFELRPTVKVTSKGLVLCTCSYHSTGSNKLMFHVPRHPVVGNIMHESSNRFSPLVSSLRNATPTKVGEFSHTFTMSQSVGGPNGVGSLTLHSYRNLNIRSDFLLNALESTFLNNRKDMLGFFNDLAEEFKLNEEDAEGFIGQPLYTEEKFEESLSSATYVPMTHIMELKDDEIRQKDVNTKSHVVVVNNCGQYGLEDSIPTKKCFKNNYNLSLLLSLILCLPRFNEFYTTLDSEFWENIIKLKKKFCSRNMNCNILLEKVNSFFGTNDVESFIGFWQKVCTKLGNIKLLINSSAEELSEITVDQPIIINITRGSRNNVTEEISAGAYQIVVRECKPMRTKANIYIHRYLPKSSTLTIHSDKAFCKSYSGIINNNCKFRFFVYIKKPLLSWDPMNLVSGQSDVYCKHHQLLLCCDQLKSKYTCGVVKCKLFSRWRCPSNNCNFCFCQKHFSVARSGNVLQMKEPDQIHFLKANDFDDSSTSSQVFLSEVNNCSNVTETTEQNFENNFDFDHFDETYFEPINSTGTFCHSIDTDAGANFVPVVTEQSGSEGDDCSFLPVQVLFNVINSVLVRPSNPINANLRFKRFLQCFVARSQSSAMSLVQMEALLFPSIFYYQTSDGNCPGALPFFIFTCQKKVEKMGFAGLLEHFRTRVADVTLLTSSSHKYIQFAVDCLINLQLNRKHSQTFFQRGIQSLKLYNEEQKLFQRDITFVSFDTEKSVRQLSAAIASSTVNFFLTLTCNQKMHPGVAPILAAIEKRFGTTLEELRINAAYSYMSTIVRCWSRSVQYLINLITYSNENILGKVDKIWGRAEFQSTAGNLPHYHVLLWIKPGTFNTNDLIQCSAKNILSTIRNIAHSSLGLVENDEAEIQNLYRLCLDIHSHCCAKGAYRCHKRVDVDGNKICRTPPYPQSHHHWVMEIDQQYPTEALKYLERLGYANFNDGNGSKVFGKLKCEKFMYAAEKGEHILPVSVPLFALTKSSVNLLRVLFKFSCSYLTSYAGKVEEHADGKITTSPGGKSFRLRSDGIQNKSLASVKFALEKEKRNSRTPKHIRCQLLPITESVFWLFGEPYIFHNMEFIHIQNVPIEKRFVVQKNNNTNIRAPLNRQNFRDFVEALPNFRKTTYNQKVLLEDSNNALEILDKMSAFNLRPPELLCFANVKLFYSLFVVEKCQFSVKDLLVGFRNGHSMPWIDCLGNEVKLRPAALSRIEAEVLQSKTDLDGMDQQRRDYLLDLLRMDDQKNWIAGSIKSSLLPEIVFRSVRPSDELNFLVSFLLRFGYFHTELDLMRSGRLLDSYKFARIIECRDSYSMSDVDSLVKKYIEEELIFLPGGVLTFSAKLLSAKSAFSRLLGVESEIVINNPIVLIEDVHSNTMQSVEAFIRTTQESMVNRIRQLGINNLPVDPLNNLLFWEPELQRTENQQTSSFLEQVSVLNKIRKSFLEKFSGNKEIRHQVILGNPGTGKTHLSGVILGLSICNGMLSFVTSLASRRAEQLSGEHIHRLFKISAKKLDSQSLANEALIKLSRDHKRRFMLTNINVLIVEEISLINAELWCAMDLILRELKDSDKSFGGAFIVANGDCCQLPNITGYNIFESYSFLFTFDFHFLENFVRMIDPVGQELLRFLERRPIDENIIEQIVHIISNRCNFVLNWNQLNDSMIMKVFGKRVAEREALDNYIEDVRNNGISYKISEARDEICNDGCKDIWRLSESRDVTTFLNQAVGETEKLIFHSSCVMRATQNISGMQQGQICVVDYETLTDCHVSVYLSPSLDSVTQETIVNQQYLHWKKITVKKQSGFVQNYFRNSVRRVQFPLANYVALTVHKLMGDTFVKLATALSSVERKFSLWLISQLYVIISRVKYLNQLFFVGDKRETLDAIRCILRRRSLPEERLYTLFCSLKNAAGNHVGPVEIESPSYLRNHFEVPETPNGYVYVLVSTRHSNFTYFMSECGKLSDELREINSTAIASDKFLYSNQPWSVGFFFWNFNDEADRKDVLKKIKMVQNISNLSFDELKNACQNELLSKPYVKFCVCGRLVTRRVFN